MLADHYRWDIRYDIYCSDEIVPVEAYISYMKAYNLPYTLYFIYTADKITAQIVLGAKNVVGIYA